MIGSRKSAITVARTAITQRVEDIKTVDIDIFDSGESEVVSREYFLKELTPMGEIKLKYIDNTTGYMRFEIKADGVKTIATGLRLDAETKLSPQLVTENPHYEIGFRLKESSGTHFLTFKIGYAKIENGKIVLDASGEPIIDRYTNHLYKFHILVRTKEKMSVVDVPQDSYRDALLNVTKLWLLSSKYDRVRRPDWAGFFDNHLRSYQMSEQGAEEVVKDLQSAIAGKISGVLISDCKATPKLKERAWEVELTSTDLSTQMSTLTASREQKMVTVNLDDDNVDDAQMLVDLKENTWQSVV